MFYCSLKKETSTMSICMAHSVSLSRQVGQHLIICQLKKMLRGVSQQCAQDKNGKNWDKTQVF